MVLAREVPVAEDAARFLVAPIDTVVRAAVTVEAEDVTFRSRCASEFAAVAVADTVGAAAVAAVAAEEECFSLGSKLWG